MYRENFVVIATVSSLIQRASGDADNISIISGSSYLIFGFKK